MILTPRVNEEGVRGRESGGPKDLIRGVALINSRETARCAVRETKREAEDRRIIPMSLCSQWQGALERTETEKAEKDTEKTAKDVELSQMQH